MFFKINVYNLCVDVLFCFVVFERNEMIFNCYGNILFIFIIMNLVMIFFYKIKFKEYVNSVIFFCLNYFVCYILEYIFVFLVFFFYIFIIICEFGIFSGVSII